MTARWAFYASLGHYAAHLAPIWLALDAEERGVFYAHPRARTELIGQGIDARDIRSGRPRAGAERVVVASANDAKRYRYVALVEHGAGQVYDLDHRAYSGGSGREMVALFLCPNEIVARRNRDSYTDAVVEVVGSPRVDALKAARIGERPPSCPVVALSFHWPCSLTLESGWAFDHFKAALPAVARRWPTVGHGHPRYAGFFGQTWRDMGVPYVARLDDVVATAWLYVCDNSSTLYEWAALDRPVVVLNSPAYRRDVDLWPRFWRCADVGVQVDEPEHLVDAVAAALADPPAIAARRRAVVDEVFPLRDGNAAERAAGALRRAR